MHLPSLSSGPFASKNLNRLRRGETWDLLTFEVAFLEFDIDSALRGASLHPREATVELVARRSGIVNCIQWWWSAQLDEHATVSNRPREVNGSHPTHWHQPLVPIGPFPLRMGDRLVLDVRLCDALGQKLTFTLRPAQDGSAHFWACPGPHLPPEPLVVFLSEWRPRWEEACARNNTMLSRHTRCGDLSGLAGLQRAALAINAHPRLFGCDPHVRDRLLLLLFGVSFR